MPSNFPSKDDKPEIIARVLADGKSFDATRVELLESNWLFVAGYEEEFKWPNFKPRTWIFPMTNVRRVELINAETISIKEKF